jgi:hypothetical protein
MQQVGSSGEVGAVGDLQDAPRALQGRAREGDLVRGAGQRKALVSCLVRQQPDRDSSGV